MHISFVTKMMTNVDGIKAFFHGLIDDKRMLSIPNHFLRRKLEQLIIFL
jgi:hypothetical protein